MKKTFKILLSIIIILFILGFTVWRIFVNYAGEYVIDTIIDSMDEDTITELEKSLDSIENLDELVIQPQPDGSETEQNSNADNTTDSELPANSKTSSENNTADNTADNTANISAETVQTDDADSKLSAIAYEDKAAAIKMMKNKFSISEIKYYQDKVLNEGITPELMAEVKSILKARCTRAEIDQIKEWYYKYR